VEDFLDQTFTLLCATVNAGDIAADRCFIKEN